MVTKSLSYLKSIATLSHKRSYASISNESIRCMKNELFEKEKRRQESLITRIEKIEIKYLGVPTNATLMMNKNMSTPYHCAMHLHDFLFQRSVLAEVNGQLWDMHRSLTEDCELRFLNFNTAAPVLNKVFWRSCSFLLGMVIERAFKNEHFVDLHSWPKPNVKSGSYVYDVDLGISGWQPTTDELKVFTTMFCKLASEDNVFERLDISESLAMQMFEHNKFKKQQIPQIISDGKITVYRVKDHVDISYGPMIGNTKFVGTSQIASVHQLDRNSGYRFQGVSIPKQLTLNSFAFSVIVDRAKKLNEIGLGVESNEERIISAN